MSEGDIVVLTSCTALKREVQVNGGEPVRSTAESLYRGQQHIRLMRGVRAYRAAGRPAGPLKLRILSAFYGLLPATREVRTYDHTFQGLPLDVIRAQAKNLRVPEEVGVLLERPFAMALLLLGDDYLRACELPDALELGGPTLAFCSPAVARRMPSLDRLRIVTVANAEAARFSCGLIGLKGELGGRALALLAEAPERLHELQDPTIDVLDWLNELPATAIRHDAVPAA